MGSIVMNKHQDGWVIVDKRMVDNKGVDNIKNFRYQNNKQKKNKTEEVKSEITDWAIINYPDNTENESKVKNSGASGWRRENKENQSSKDSGGTWWEISLKD